MNVPRLLPAKLGRYDVGAKIGGGGMATIYLGRARDGSLAALKVIKDELASAPTYMDMFFDEAKILSRLSHPNVIHTLEYGVDGENRFIAMELLLGRSLMDVWDVLATRGTRIPVALGAWICARVAEGLHAAHELKNDQGALLEVIHRDVNPSNVFLTYDGTVKLIDFGLAKSIGRRTKSKTGIVKGKVPYLAPEQITETVIDRRADLYALGTTIWECATMNRLFKRENDVATLMAIRDATVPDVRLITPEYPVELWRVIDKALQRDRDQRYSTAAEIQRDLDAYLAEHAPQTGAQTLAAFLDGHFAADKKEQVAWVDVANVIGQARPQYTMPPPRVVPAVPPPVPKAASASPTGAIVGTPTPPIPLTMSSGHPALHTPRRGKKDRRKAGSAELPPNRKERRRRGGRQRSSMPPPMPSRRDATIPTPAPSRAATFSSHPPPADKTDRAEAEAKLTAAVEELTLTVKKDNWLSPMGIVVLLLALLLIGAVVRLMQR